MVVFKIDLNTAICFVGSRPQPIPKPHSTIPPAKRINSRQGQSSLHHSLEKSRSCLTLNGYDSSTGRRSRADSVSSLLSLPPFSNRFDALSTDDFPEDRLSDFDSESSNFLSQDAPYQSSQDLDVPFSLSSSLNTETDASPTDGNSGQNRDEPPEETDQGGDESDNSTWTTVDRKKKPIAATSLRKERTKSGM